MSIYLPVNFAIRCARPRTDSGGPAAGDAKI